MVIEYVRDLGGGKVQETLRDGFLKNTTPAEYGRSGPLSISSVIILMIK